LVQREGLVAFCTSDTNKDAAKGKNNGDARELATAAFRGSYKLFHLPDAALLLERGEDGRSASVSVAKNRWGPQLPDPKACAHFRWNPTRATFTPLSPTENTAKHEAQKKAKAEKVAKKGAKDAEATLEREVAFEKRAKAEGHPGEIPILWYRDWQRGLWKEQPSSNGTGANDGERPIKPLFDK
jgi:hypothetical protein